MKQLYRVRPLGGIISDLPASEVGDDYYTDGRNVRFSDGIADTILGTRQIYGTPLAPPLQIINAQNGLVSIPEGGVSPTPANPFPGAQDLWVYVSSAGQFAVTVDGHTDLTLTGLSSQPQLELHSLASLNGVTVHNNAVDAPMYWAGDLAQKFAPLPGWPTDQKARVMRSHLFHLFALDIAVGTTDAYPLRVVWSDAAEPGVPPATWTPAADNQAGFTDLADTAGALMTAETLRDTLLIYKRDAIYAADFVGGDQVYAFRSLFRGVGALNPRAVAVTPDGHIVVTDSDVMLTDGNTIHSIAAGKIRKRINALANTKEAAGVFAIYHASRRETIIAVPGGSSSSSYYLTWSHDSKAWGILDNLSQTDELTSAAVGIVATKLFPVTWDEESAVTWGTNSITWDQSPYAYANSLISTDPVNNKLLLLDDPAGAIVSALVEKTDMHFGEPERMKFVRRVHIRRRPGAPSSNMFVRVGSRMTLNDSITWSESIPLAGNQQIVNCRALGRYISVRVSSGATQPWSLSGFDLEVELRGYQ